MSSRDLTLKLSSLTKHSHDNILVGLVDRTNVFGELRNSIENHIVTYLLFYFLINVSR